MSPAPTLRVERELLRGGVRLLAAVDEVGRGSLAGPVTVGVVVVGPGTRTAPAGVRDSKLLTAAARQALAPRLRRWAVDHAVGSASAAEIDAFGIVPAMRLAGERALAALTHRPDLVLLDGNHDWLTRPPLQAALFDTGDDVDGIAEVARRRAAATARADAEGLPAAPPVVVRVKADRTCSSVAAASVLAKTDRDALMVSLAPRHPEFGWDVNKGYASPDHLEALERHGPCALHRRSWRLRGCGDPPGGSVAGPVATPHEAVAG